MKAGTVAVALGLLALGAPAQAQGGRVVAPPTFSPGQEAALLTGSRMVTASQRCDGVTLDDDKLTAMMRAAGISARDMVLKQRTDSLKARVEAYAHSFKGHRDEVCAEALAEGRRNGLLR